jgi:hypothetical protein
MINHILQSIKLLEPTSLEVGQMTLKLNYQVHFQITHVERGS